MKIFNEFLFKLSVLSKTPDDHRLVELFTGHVNELSEHFECLIPKPDGTDWLAWTPDQCPLNELHGQLFHSGFRKYYVITESVDTEIWQLLTNGKSAFWKLHSQFFSDMYK